ncbi:MAG: 16S rRNA (cytosine(1402)-N(4))-methyltransferase RsmH [Chloroflexota bacterium]|nr:16S rRNA (cytosine(1402)-N(4))-methyltransferase RsmH [Chloroflexota bacterium]
MVALAASIKDYPLGNFPALKMTEDQESAVNLANTPLHDPVLSREAVEHLCVRSGSVYVDATAGEGGHSLALLQASAPSGRVLGIDRDPLSLARARKRLELFGNRFIPAEGNFADIYPIAQRSKYTSANGILLDLGLSSWQLESSGAGFSFQRNEPLDMRFDRGGSLPTASDLINFTSEEELIRILFDFGEEPKARAIAKSIILSRSKFRIETTAQLLNILKAIPGLGRGRRTHPATRTFQAFRIAVNEELTNLQKGIIGAISLLASGGRLAIISYHSLEDRIVKQTFSTESTDCICDKTLPVCICGHQAIIRIINRRIITPTSTEVRSNPRSRSARMRVIEKI